MDCSIYFSKLDDFRNCVIYQNIGRIHPIGEGTELIWLLFSKVVPLLSLSFAISRPLRGLEREGFGLTVGKQRLRASPAYCGKLNG
jgi:hypothetical protein